PSTWIPSPTSFTAPEFVKLVRSYRARFRANIARTPAERAAANWTTIIADAQNGITGDFLATTSNSTTAGTGMANAWRAQYAGAGWGWSNYDFQRFHPWRVAGDAGTGQQGNTIYFAKTEVDMLQAEGLIRTGNYAGAAALINITRTRNGLPAITTFDGTSPVP